MNVKTGRPRQVERAARMLREQLPDMMRGGDRMPPVRDLATRVGVSVKTLRAAQALLAREGLLDIRHGSGVYLTELARPRLVGIASSFDVFQPHASPFHLHVIHYLRRLFVQQGLEAQFYVGSDMAGEWQDAPADRRLLADLENGRLAGLVILNAPPTFLWEQWVARLPIPAVGAHTAHRVAASTDHVLRQAVRHLHAHGCRHIAMLDWAYGGLREPFHDALEACGLEIHPEWVRHDLEPTLDGAGWEEFREIWSARREKPDGLVVTDDVLFDDAVTAIQELGIQVPDQLRIVTHANKGVRRRYPFPVTQAVVDPELYAEMLGGLLLKRLRGEPVEQPNPVMPIEMVEFRPAGAPVKQRFVPHEVEVEEERLAFNA